MITSTSAGSQRAVSLEAQDVTCRYGTTTAVDGVSLHVTAGRCIALVGESGSGKSTLLRCFNRMTDPVSGTVLLDGQNVESSEIDALRRGIGYVPQHGGLLPHWTVLRNVALVPRLLGLDANAAAGSALALVGLPAREFGVRFPHQLSGGQRQRVALARALAARPPILLLDEPFGALDAITRADVQTTFVALRAELDITVLLVTHDLAEAARLADEIVVLRAGRVEQRGTAESLRRSPGTAYVAELFARAIASAAQLVAVR